MDKVLQYTTTEQQIELLKNKGLSFLNESIAIEQLNTYGYFNIINSYKDPYITNNHDMRYKPGVTFEQIFSLFTLDHNLRNSIMAAMLDLEEYLRAVVAEVIASSFGVDHNEYLKKIHFSDKHSYIPARFRIESILQTLTKNAESGKNPIKYYRETYGIIPPWILFKGTYFSTLVNFIRSFKDTEKRVLISKLYGIDPSEVNPELKALLLNTLYTCLDYRNLAAHGGRIYNFISEHSTRISYSPGYLVLSPTMSDLDSCYGIAKLLILMDAFVYQKPNNLIKDSLEVEINRHLKYYPKDRQTIESAVCISIELAKGLWVSGKNKIFHIDPACSGLKNPMLMKIEDLQAHGYMPCKRCSKQFYKANSDTVNT